MLHSFLTWFLTILNTLFMTYILSKGVAEGVKYFSSRRKLRATNKKIQKNLSRLGYDKIFSTLNEYELSIATQLVHTSQIDVSFKDIGGLDDVVETIRSSIILPLALSPILNERWPYFQPPKGVLLYGPPGCGKTMIAKAVAKEAKANFINLELSTLFNKWYGESEHRTLALFTLAEKLQPCIIFIDEIDAFLRSRGEHDHEITARMKAQFLLLWDGLLSRKVSNNIVVLGATNRPGDVDEAIRRRMPAMFEIPLPNRDQREDILQILLKNESLEKDIDIGNLADLTNNFSASDLKEFCRNAVFVPVRDMHPEIIKQLSDSDGKTENGILELMSKLRRTNNNDFLIALERMKQNKLSNMKRNNSSSTHRHDEQYPWLPGFIYRT